MASKGEGSDVALFETWNGPRCVLRLTVPNTLHGKVINDGQFSGGVSWSKDESKIAYVADVDYHPDNSPEAVVMCRASLHSRYPNGGNQKKWKMVRRYPRPRPRAGKGGKHGSHPGVKDAHLLDVRAFTFSIWQLEMFRNCSSCQRGCHVVNPSGNPMIMALSLWDGHTFRATSMTHH